ncbi:tRNA glutamyl-Q(34) synthetase GluQRS [Rubritalea marina]|uniref:tRNA glutamyl-Q(34) synthetase GluQRS n=1 Tax=Rubritalea marina TaxID=361055 RepID=UPI000375EDFA|nr:tRNA glutamyl-Q(34) synthetase GluQRS [Rubritalea marina]
MAIPEVEVITRFAPSPTGLLHLGHLYSAHLAHQLALSTQGQFLVRFEDIDETRTRDTFYQAIEEDLEWAGLHAPKPFLRQRDRLAAYDLALDKLKELGVIYPCFCTRREIQNELTQLAHAPHGSDGPHYPQICHGMSDSQINQKLAEGRTPSWRLDARKAGAIVGALSFHDHYHGKITVQPELLGDLILARKDIGTSYHIAVVVDDAYQGISDVVRGRDLLDSTHIHRLLQVLLELPEPRYHHHPLVTDDTGVRLAKRHAARSLQSLRSKQGLTPQQALELALRQQEYS